VTFAEALRAAALRGGLTLREEGHPEPLAHLDYGAELRLKNEALQAFAAHHGLKEGLAPIVPAPKPRGYRATTKRRARFSRQGLALAFAADAAMPSGVSESQLDAPEHRAIYAFTQGQLSRPGMSPLAAELNYVIVRGYAPNVAVILNLRAFDGRIVGAAKRWAEALQAAALGVRSAFLYLDPTGSDYYLEARRPVGKLSWKKLFGPEALEVRVDGRRLRFPPVVFSQVNEAMLGTLTATARDLAGSLAGRSFVDLYCGYGLFSLCLGGEARSAVGIDAEGPAIEAAQENAKHAGMSQARFIAGRVTGEFLAERLRPSERAETILLDPPRQGTGPGVVEALARRRADAVLHIFCGTDEMPAELERWRRAGYDLARATPLDLFPGSANLETLALLKP
jgi:tRNA/tmRNA/rRNA uracil-C5-methylase (TrmA/RlmC/RlmD family)